MDNVVILNQPLTRGQVIGVLVAAGLGAIAFIYNAAMFCCCMSLTRNVGDQEGTKEDEKHYGEYNAADMKKKMQDMKEYIQKDADIGVITIACMRVRMMLFSRKNKVANQDPSFIEEATIVYLMFLILVAQLCIPVAVFLSTYEAYLGGICPGDASWYSKAAAFLVGGYYVAKLTFLIREKVRSYKYAPKFISGQLKYLVMCDRFMDIAYEICVYLLNLWIVFVIVDPLEAVLSAVAMEFIVKMDDEIKEMYYKVYPPTERSLQASISANNAPTGCFGRWLTSTGVLLNFFGAAFGLGLVSFGFIIQPVCKGAEGI